MQYLSKAGKIITKSVKMGSQDSQVDQAKTALEFFKKSSTLSSLLKLLDEKVEIYPEMQDLINLYNTSIVKISEKYSHLNKDIKTIKHPLIVLEGLDGCGKSTVGKKLANELGAERMSTPPSILSEFRESFDNKNTLIRRLFYYLGNYIADAELREILKTKPVVLDRFWHSTTVYALAQLNETYGNILDDAKIPEKGNEVYEWPKDLIVPDKVFLLNVSEAVRIERLSRRKQFTAEEELLKSKEVFRTNVLLAYDNMVNPAIEKIDGDLDFKGVLQQIKDKLPPLNTN